MDKFNLSHNSAGVLADSMKVALLKNQNETNNYWNTLNDYEEELLNTKDEDLTSDSKFIGRFFRRLFSGTDTQYYCLNEFNYEYKNNQYFKKSNRWCGPWACAYILYVEQHIDKYNFFESCASSVGELSVLNFALRIFGRPLTPMEMAWSMPIASRGQIWINPILYFKDFCAYDNIVNYQWPALRLCASGGSLHWTIAYGATQTGCWAWRNYYFRQIDNGALINNEALNTYTSVEWWNPWLMVYL